MPSKGIRVSLIVNPLASTNFNDCDKLLLANLIDRD